MEVAEPRARQPPTLPMDLLLEIIARSDDVTTVVRCAAGCKPLRHAMLGPGFLDLLRRRAEANGGFDPALLMAVSYLPAASSIGTDSIVVQPPGRIRLDTDLLPRGPSKTASSRDGLLVVHRDGILLVCNTITGHVTSLPSTDLGGCSSASMFQPALLSVDGAGRSFELLVMYRRDNRLNGWSWSDGMGMLGAEIFSSQEGKWGATREIHIHNLPKSAQLLREASASAPAVVGRSVHWLCYIRPIRSIFANISELIILAFHGESGHASVIKLPQELPTRKGSSSSLGGLHAETETRILATTATVGRENRLSLVVAEEHAISMWILVPEVAEGSSISWSRQVVIRRREMPLANVLDAYQPILLITFGERSGTVLFWMEHVGLVQLNLGTKKALVLWRGSNHDNAARTVQPFLHEMNLISVLECMKSF